MKRSPFPGADLGVYLSALPLLVRNPALIVVPLLALVIGVLLRQVLAPLGTSGGLSSLTLGLGQLIATLIALLGLGSACIMADEAWRTGRASFERGWAETQRKSGDILYAAIGITLLLAVASYAAQIVGVLGLLLMALAVFFLIWAIPAAAAGGVPGGASIQVSIDRVRSAPLAAAIATIVTLALLFYVMPLLGLQLTVLLAGALPPTTPVVNDLISAVLQAIGMAYIALILTKTYTDAAYGRRW
jgi:hypothetical protein